MSRVGKNPVYFDGSKVKVTLSDEHVVTVAAGKKTEAVPVQEVINVEVKDGQVVLTRKNDEPKTRAFHGLYRALIQNAVTGVTTGWKKELELNGVGYRSAVKGKTLELNLGYSHPIEFPIPEGIEIKVEKQTIIEVSGSNRGQVGQVAAVIRGFRPPEPFLGKGVKYSDEVIRRKAGKSAGK